MNFAYDFGKNSSYEFCRILADQSTINTSDEFEMGFSFNFEFEMGLNDFGFDFEMGLYDFGFDFEISFRISLFWYLCISTYICLQLYILVLK